MFFNLEEVLHPRIKFETLYRLFLKYEIKLILFSVHNLSNLLLHEI